MKKRTSKSASGSPKTSSQSGMSGKMEDTAGQPVKRPKLKGKFAYLVTKLQQMSNEEFRQSLVDAEIIDENGELTEHYKPKPKPKARAKKKKPA